MHTRYLVQVGLKIRTYCCTSMIPARYTSGIRITKIVPGTRILVPWYLLCRWWYHRAEIRVLCSVPCIMRVQRNTGGSFRRSGKSWCEIKFLKLRWSKHLVDGQEEERTMPHEWYYEYYWRCIIRMCRVPVTSDIVHGIGGLFSNVHYLVLKLIPGTLYEYLVWNY